MITTKDGKTLSDPTVSDKPACGSCRFYREVPLQKDLGTCRKVLPALVMSQQGPLVNVWPAVESRNGWCHEYQPVTH
jgi:hypothetical protein